MKYYLYRIVFKTGFIVNARAHTKEEARILAQASEIRAGREWREIESVTQETK